MEPELQWKTLPKEQVTQALQKNGLPENAVKNLIELGEAIHSGMLRVDYDLNRPYLGKVSLEDFAKDFAKAYHK